MSTVISWIIIGSFLTILSIHEIKSLQHHFLMINLGCQTIAREYKSSTIQRKQSDSKDVNYIHDWMKEEARKVLKSFWFETYEEEMKNVFGCNYRADIYGLKNEQKVWIEVGNINGEKLLNLIEWDRTPNNAFVYVPYGSYPKIEIIRKLDSKGFIQIQMPEQKIQQKLYVA